MLDFLYCQNNILSNWEYHGLVITITGDDFSPNVKKTMVKKTDVSKIKKRSNTNENIENPNDKVF